MDYISQCTIEIMDLSWPENEFETVIQLDKNIKQIQDVEKRTIMLY